MVRQRIARVNASLASRSALRGIDPRDPPPKTLAIIDAPDTCPRLH